MADCLPTLLLMHSCVFAVLGAFLYLVWREDPEADEYRWWCAAQFAISIGLALLSFRASYPLLAIGLGNALTLWGVGLAWGGARVFSGRPVDMRLAAAGGVIWLLFFSSSVDSVRVVDRCAISAVYAFLLADEFGSIRRQRTITQQATIALAAAHACFGAVVAVIVVALMARGEAIDLKPFIVAITFESLSYGLLIGFALLAVTKERAVERQKFMAATDPLTGLSNRRSFDHNADVVIRNSRGQGDSALLIFDLDRLKTINDSFGHSMGDRALTTFGEVAAKSIRDEDFLARIGGDEFALLLTRVDGARAVAVAERIRCAYVSATAALGDGLSSVSVGIALSGHETSDLSALKEAADKALYAAKSSGRNQVFVAQS
ncbi:MULTISPECIES: GGDEF domain-containing protein [Methylosinus]|nr:MULTISPECIES: GGDEF domain-containing protein [Methylosinus]MBU3887733.1 GGDEF domain-containing protein [Methylosinus sp. KRF6]TRL21176.1 GGDEF domain-containing protein [Methylosinus sporium]